MPEQPDDVAQAYMDLHALGVPEQLARTHEEVLADIRRDEDARRAANGG